MITNAKTNSNKFKQSGTMQKHINTVYAQENETIKKTDLNIS